MTPAAAATLPTGYMTALECLAPEDGGVGSVGPADAVLVHAAAGGLGLAACAVAASAGSLLLATAGSPDKRALAKAEGRAVAALSSRDCTFADGLVALALRGKGGRADGRHADSPTTTTPVPLPTVILNSLTSPGMVAASLAVLSPGGALVEVSKRGVWSPQRVAQERPDAHYRVVAVDFKAAPAVGAAMRRISGLIAKGEGAGIWGWVEGGRTDSHRRRRPAHLNPRPLSLLLPSLKAPSNL